MTHDGSAIAGTLTPLGFAELLRAALRTGASGRMVIRRHGVSRTVCLERGSITSARSSASEDSLAEFLLREKVATWHDLRSLGAQARNDRDLLARLVERGALRGARLRECSRRHEVEILLALFEWADGSWEFEPVDPPADGASQLPTVEVVLRGVRSIRSWSRVEAAVGGPDTPWGLSPALSGLAATLDLAPEEWSLVGAMSEPRPLVELLRLTSLGELEACRLLWALRVLGAAERPPLAGEAELEASLAGAMRGAGPADDLVHGDRAPLELGAETAGASLSGSLTGLKLPDLLRSLYRRRANGILTVACGRESSRIYLTEGTIVAATSTSPQLRLGDVLRRHGLLSDSALARVVAAGGSEPLGVRLLRDGILDPATLSRAIEIQVREILTPLFGWTEGHYLFEEGDPELGELPVSELSLAEVILAGVRATPALRGVREMLGKIGGCLGPAADPLLRFQRTRLRPAEALLLTRMDGTASVAELIASSPLDGDETCRVIYGLLAAGVVEVVRPGRRVRPLEPPPALGPFGPGEVEQLVTRSEGVDLYALLGVADTVGDDGLGAAFAEAAFRTHPDRGRTRAEKEALEQVFARVIEAASVLASPAERRRYDLSLERRPEPERARIGPALPAEPPPVVGPRERPLERPAENAAISAEAKAAWGEGGDLTQQRREAAQLFRAGVAAANGSDYTAAVTYLRRAVNMDPQNVRFLEELGAVYARNPLWRNRAEETLRHALALAPTSLSALLALARLYRRGGKPKAAVELYRQVLAIDGRNHEARGAIAELNPPVGSALGRALGSILGHEAGHEPEDKPATGE